MIVMMSLWAQQGVGQGQAPLLTLMAKDGSAYDDFGRVLAFSAHTLAVGSPGWEPSSSFQDVGAVYLFENSPLGWLPSAQLVPTTPTHHAGFGSALALSGSTLAVGSPTGFGANEETGLVQVFENGPAGWQATQTLLGSSSTEDDRFGSALTIDGGTLWVGAPADDLVGKPTGRVFVYHNANGTWQGTGALDPPSAAVEGWSFGQALAASGARVAVGSPGAYGSRGQVDLFEHQAGGWQGVLTLKAPCPAAGDRFGAQLSFAGGVLAVGVPGAGRVDLFETVGPGLQRVHSIQRDALSCGFGSYLQLTDTWLAVGGAETMGQVRLFRRAGAGWVEVAALSERAVGSSEVFGGSLALAGDRLAVGSPTAATQGRVSLYSLEASPEVATFCLGQSCPCGNLMQGAACMNSAGQGARLSAWGSLDLGIGGLSLVADQGPVGPIALLLAGAKTAPSFFGDGTLCIGGSAGLLGATRLVGQLQFGVDGSGEFACDLGLLRNAARAGVLLELQAVYRDVSGPCGSGFNTSNGIALELCL